ncbi:MAG: hypothetical protein JXA33_14220 [Anaerolineae bacterium]|nr:hypothetical protein [Anaerolineae bacterium]
MTHSSHSQRLYYDDSSLLRFEAHIVECRDHERGAVVLLDRTAFYPTSGGQPHDVGLLDDIPVLDVWVDEETDSVWHLLASKPAVVDPSRVVLGNVDGLRRFDHSQQHTGQHLLSAVFVELLNANTIGFHLSSRDTPWGDDGDGRQPSSTIDLDILELSWATAFQIEMAVNQWIWENVPVMARFVKVEELAQMSALLRKPPAVTDHVRIVSIADREYSACGGTHVRHTGEIGMLKITSIERYKGGTRVTFLCGGRALCDYQRVLRLLQCASVSLSVAQDELPGTAERLQKEVKACRKALSKAQTELLQMEAEQLWQSVSAVDGIRRIVQHWERDFAEVQMLGRALREKPRTVILLAATEEKSVRLICARSDDLAELNAGSLVRTAAGVLGGRGGGSPTLAQAGVPCHPPEVILAALYGALEIV